MTSTWRSALAWAIRVRRSRIFPGLVASYANTAVGVICNFVAVPLYLRFLGREEYGLWLAVSGVVAYLGLLNLGVVQTTSTLVGTSVTAGDTVHASRVLATGFWTFARVSLVAAVGVLLVSPALPWKALIKGSQALQGEGRTVLILCALGFLAELPTGVFGGALRAVGQIRLQQRNAAFQNVGRVSVALAYLGMGGGLRGLVVALSAVNMAVGILNYRDLRRTVEGIRVSPRLRDPSLARTMRAPSFFFLLLQVSSAIAFSADALVVSSHLGTASVAPYGIAQRLTFIALGLVMAVGSNYGPFFLDAYSKADTARLRALFVQATRASLALAAAAALSLLLVGPSFIRWWVGASNYVGFFPFSMMVLLMFVQMTLGPADALLTITANHRLYAVAGAWEAALSLGLSLWLVRPLGVGGVALGTIIARMLGAGPVSLWASWRLVRGLPSFRGT